MDAVFFPIYIFTNTAFHQFVNVLWKAHEDFIWTYSKVETVDKQIFIGGGGGRGGVGKGAGYQGHKSMQLTHKTAQSPKVSIA